MLGILWNALKFIFGALFIFFVIGFLCMFLDKIIF